MSSPSWKTADRQVTALRLLSVFTNDETLLGHVAERVDQLALVFPRALSTTQMQNGRHERLLVKAYKAAWVLGNIAADCKEYRQQIIANGAVMPLVKLLSNHKYERIDQNQCMSAIEFGSWIRDFSKTIC